MNRDHVGWGSIPRTFATLFGQRLSSVENSQPLENLQLQNVKNFFKNSFCIKTNFGE